ncbi:hypothetical protein E2C01_027477 [Portunus trituberculatus]|uniref:Uncharacterized protein n=1 Tax=Portunus trituberculatus TaxID=210409 RepID=A0A5B7ELQ8_PORTR|nr:hypothetical protein [Portunus trituberculatus]
MSRISNDGVKEEAKLGIKVRQLSFLIFVRLKEDAEHTGRKREITLLITTALSFRPSQEHRNSRGSNCPLLAAHNKNSYLRPFFLSPVEGNTCPPVSVCDSRLYRFHGFEVKVLAMVYYDASELRIWHLGTVIPGECPSYPRTCLGFEPVCLRNPRPKSARSHCTKSA